uniref:Head-tail joining protein n=1 Tax=viral metagenome TaxID=1070528 RepID=A0A6M3LYI5_9ZZZZ
MPRAASFISRRGETVTLRTLALDTAARDATTQWPSASYTETTIKAIVEPVSTRRIDIGGAPETETRATIHTASAIHMGDQIIYNLVTYVITAEPTPHRKRGATSFFTAPMERGPS